MKTKDFDHLILMYVIFFYVFGIIMIYSASGYYAYKHLDAYPGYFAVKHLIFGLIGLVLLFLGNSINIESTRKYIGIGLLVIFILLILVLIPGIGNRAGGAARWIKIGFIKIQPSEFVKVFLIFFIANYIDRNRNDMDSFSKGFLPPMLIIAVLLGLIVKEPDFSTSLIIGTLSLTILFIGGVKIRYLLGLFLVGILIASAIVIHSPYKLNRIKAWLNIEADPLSKGYHITRSKLAICTGGFLGKGLSNSEVKIAGLPESHTDFIFAIMCEELGFAGIIFLLFFYLALIYRGIKVVLNINSQYLKFIAIGITLMLAMHVTINIGVVTGILPTTGITLPFLSYGGSSLIVFMFSMGILLNISSQTNRNIAGEQKNVR
ncbi:putative lipid II flippase FtsW [Candidatus Dependentiae bacterium]|nr:putative lipid II flippase FtsW [Candidatus Dependentiae bacterium]